MQYRRSKGAVNDTILITKCGIKFVVLNLLLIQYKYNCLIKYENGATYILIEQIF